MDFQHQRERMVGEQIAARGVRDRRVLRAMADVPRERFVAPELAARAYQDGPLTIGFGQTISQPFIVAFMAEALALTGKETILEVGTGSGYGAAVLGRLGREVFTIERNRELATAAAARLDALGFRNVHVVQGDGTLGLPAHAPYDAIAVTAGGPQVPPALVEQLAPGGRLVIPVGEDPSLQRLMRVVRQGQDELVEQDLGAVAFVPLVGAAGWDERS